MDCKVQVKIVGKSSSTVVVEVKVRLRRIKEEVNQKTERRSGTLLPEDGFDVKEDFTMCLYIDGMTQLRKIKLS